MVSVDLMIEQDGAWKVFSYIVQGLDPAIRELRTIVVLWPA